MTIIVAGDESVERVERVPFDDEKELQNYISANPEVIPLYETDENAEVMVVAKEIPCNSGAIDALGLDSEGRLYVIETKLGRNSDKRQVTAQALDYGAALWKHTNDFLELQTQLDQRSREQFGAGFAERAKQHFDLSDEAFNGLVEDMRTRLAEGDFKFVILMDHIEERLKDLALYVNHYSQFDVFLVELAAYEYGDTEIIVPDLYGSEVKKQTSIANTVNDWDEDEFFEQAQNKISEEEVTALREVYEFVRSTGENSRWGQGKLASFLSDWESEDEAVTKVIVKLTAEGEMIIKTGRKVDGWQGRDLSAFRGGLEPIDTIDAEATVLEEEIDNPIMVEKISREADRQQFLNALQALVEDPA